MRKHPISAFFRLLPALLWLGATVVTLAMALSLYLQFRQALVPLGFVVVAIYAVYMTWKSYREELPALRADRPIEIGLPKRPKPPREPTRYPLSDELRAQLRKLIESLQSAGVLQAGEVELEEVVDCAETLDAWQEVDLYTTMHVLRAMRSSYANIAFFETQVEVFEADLVKLVSELARLCGRSAELGEVRVRSRSDSRDAVAEFVLGGQRHSVPFTFHPKNMPEGLVERAGKLLAGPGGARRLAWGYFDSFFAVALLSAAEIALIPDFEPVPHDVHTRESEY